MVSAIIVAAGKGERLAGGKDKPFVSLGGQTLLSYSLALFEKVPEVAAVILVVAEKRRKDAGLLVSRHNFRKVKRIVAGGTIRQKSVENGLAVIAAETRTVLIHDAARPFVSEKKVKELIRKGRKSAVIPVLPVSDTLKEIEAGRVLRTLDRRCFYTVQTPQAFPKDIILTAYRQAKDTGLVGTDDASLLEAAGFPVEIIEGEKTNIKITYPEDLLAAEAILRASYGISD